MEERWSNSLAREDLTFWLQAYGDILPVKCSQVHQHLIKNVLLAGIIYFTLPAKNSVTTLVIILYLIYNICFGAWNNVFVCFDTLKVTFTRTAAGP